MKRENAQHINDLMLEYAAKLNSSLQFIKDNDSNEEFQKYRLAVGELLGKALDIMNVIYSEHPDMKPKELL
jgi:hypothetical protein